MWKAFRRLGGLPPRTPISFQRPLSGDPFRDVSSTPGWDTLGSLPLPALRFVAEGVRLCRPSSVQLCDGSPEEGTQLFTLLQDQGVLHPLPKYDNCWLARTDPRDVARVEKQTVLVTEKERDSVPPAPPSGAPRQLGNWMSPDALEEAIAQRFPGCMEGRRLYAIPFLMGPPGSPLAQAGLQLTDSPYVAASMRIMTRVGPLTRPYLEGGAFVRCLHSVGRPLDDVTRPLSQWPCDPQRVLVAHQPDRGRVVSYGSGYGGNSLLGKKCLALRIASRLARDQGWLAEHMLILSLTDPRGRTRYLAAAFPSACGKTNLAMMAPALPGWRLRCLGDDIAWMRFDPQGRLRAINPERGFFGVAPGTSPHTNPHAMATLASNTIFTNVGATSDGGVYWEGLDPPPGVTFTDWLGQPWKPGDPRPCAHPNSRFCAPASQCPIMDPAWEDPQGVPIDAIIFGGRRPRGVPLVLEALSWRHGVFLGSAMRSEATAAAEHTGRRLLHDPFAMRPFFGYNAGRYLSHWLAMGQKDGAQLPKIFHVNWFLRDPASGTFLWPGFGHNSRVLAWIFSRVVGEDPNPKSTPWGWIPREEALDLKGLQGVSYPQLFPMDRDFWDEETRQLRAYYQENFGEDLPREVLGELEALEGRLKKM